MVTAGVLTCVVLLLWVCAKLERLDGRLETLEQTAVRWGEGNTNKW